MSAICHSRAELVEADRSALAALWPPASIPVLVDDGVVIAESSIIVEYLDRHGDAPPLIPNDPEEALQARLWDRVADGYITTPVQRIVGDALRPAGAKDRHGVSQAHATLDLAYATVDRQLSGRGHDGWLAGEDFTLADCAAAPALHYADVLHPLDHDAHPALADTSTGTGATVGRARDPGGPPLPQAVPAALARARELSASTSS